MSSYQYKREISERLLRAAQDFPAVVLTGARQVGKTTLLKRIFPGHTYVSLDDPITADLAEESPEEFLRRFPAPLLIDEVQYAPKVLRHIKTAIDRDRHQCGRFILTGSQKFQLMHGVTESLAGRVALFELEPLHLSEIHKGFPTVYDEFSAADFMIRGFYPELWRNPSLDETDFFRSYLATYLERDLRQIVNVTSLREFDRFMRSCSARSGQLLNKSDLAKDLGLSAKTVGNWLGVLEVSNQVLLLEPYFGNIQKRLIKTPKLYFGDVGLATYLLNINANSIANHPLVGGLWETLVYAELRKNLKVRNSRASLYFYRDQQSREIDFVIDVGGGLHLIECKWKEIPQAIDAKSLKSLRQEVRMVKSCHIISNIRHPSKIAGEDIRIWGIRDIQELINFIDPG